jgi:bisphosphoglycerate-independent phosphoglycerate mutase (AlkP superfamily)
LLQVFAEEPRSNATLDTGITEFGILETKELAKLLAVTFFVDGEPEGSVTTTKRSLAATVDVAVSSVILVAVILVHLALY